ncbi:MAG: rhodanese-like domain-containing protein [Phycisphaerales bacterium]|nr:rhodanese-like domain-containing protein [Phycisphaerales bacterium]
MITLDNQGLPAGYPYNSSWEITPRQLQQLRLEQGKFHLLDVRTSAERDIACIDGSQHIALLDLEGQMGELRAHEGSPVIVYCHHGIRSFKAAAILRQAGFLQVRSLAGGIHLWSVDIDSAVPIY